VAGVQGLMALLREAFPTVINAENSQKERHGSRCKTDLDKSPVALHDRKSGRSKKCSAEFQHSSSRFWLNHTTQTITNITLDQENGKLTRRNQDIRFV